MSDTQPPARLRGLRVLLVEDDPDTADVVRTMLTVAGAEVAWAPDAASALEQLERGRFDVVVADYALGAGQSGFELLQRIRSGAEDPHVPVIGYSAHAAEVAAHEQEAFTAYAAKPQFLDNLVGLVRGVAVRRSEMVPRA